MCLHIDTAVGIVSRDAAITYILCLHTQISLVVDPVYKEAIIIGTFQYGILCVSI